MASVAQKEEAAGGVQQETMNGMVGDGPGGASPKKRSRRQSTIEMGTRKIGENGQQAVDEDRMRVSAGISKWRAIAHTDGPRKPLHQEQVDRLCMARMGIYDADNDGEIDDDEGGEVRVSERTRPPLSSTRTFPFL